MGVKNDTRHCEGTKCPKQSPWMFGDCFVVPRIFGALLAMTVLTTSCFAADKAALVREGNQLYNKGKIDDALKSYNKALTTAPEEPLINFNIGNALYRKSQYKDAAGSYEKALLSPDKKQEAQANYNIGNCKFRQGRQKESSDLPAAIAEYRRSLDYYKRAMELDPDDKDAKFNHEFVEKLLKTLQQQKSGQEGQEGQKSQGQEKKEQESHGAQQDKQQAQQQMAQPKEQKQEGQEQQQEYQLGGDIAKEGKEPDKEMSKGEASVLLDDYRQQEQQERQLGDKQAPMRYPNVEKDW